MNADRKLFGISPMTYGELECSLKFIQSDIEDINFYVKCVA